MREATINRLRNKLGLTADRGRQLLTIYGYSPALSKGKLEEALEEKVIDTKKPPFERFLSYISLLSQ